LLVAAIAAGIAAAAGTDGTDGTQAQLAQPFRPHFGVAGLVTNEYAYRHPDGPGRHLSRDWTVTSGSLFARNGAGWTGIPDRESPNAGSSAGTDSSVFRLVSRRRDFENVRVSFQLLVQRHVVPAYSQPQSFDGVHVWLRYQDATDLYALSVMRWDGEVVIKGKSTGGDVNGGTYRTLASARAPLQIGRWVQVSAEARTTGRGVELTITIGDRRVLRAFDTSSQSLISAGGVGIRGDNTEFEFRNFEAVQLA
jgi:hypothetical protein